jgi:hypothetical protein
MVMELYLINELAFGWKKKTGIWLFITADIHRYVQFLLRYFKYFDANVLWIAHIITISTCWLAKQNQPFAVAANRYAI